MIAGAKHMKSSLTSSTRKKADGKNVFILLAVLTVLAAILSMSLGAVMISPASVASALLKKPDVPASVSSIVLYVRLPRTCGCLLAGAALAVSGAVIQSVLSNPLAAPNIIGVNSGAGFAVVLCAALFPAEVKLVPAAAFAGALICVFFVLLIAEKTGASRMTLVLAGIAISSIFSAGIDAVVTLKPDALTGYSNFKIGGLANLTMGRITPAFWIIIIAFIVLLSLSNELDILMLGRDTAQSLGLHARALQFILLGLAAALAGAAISFSGLLGFIGLIVPHIMRRFLGGDSLRLITGSAFGGAIFLTGCDLLARTLFIPFEIPVGIVLALLGGPFFIWLLLRQRGGRIH